MHMVLMTDEQRFPDPSAMVQALPRGSWVVLRHYGMASALRHDLARRLVVLCRKKGLKLLIAANASTCHWRLAAKLRIDGVHLGEAMAKSPPSGLLSWRKHRSALLTCAAHNRMALGKAARWSADAVTISPIFPTLSHPEAKTMGALRFRLLAQCSPRPVLALGGVNKASLRHLKGAKMTGAAMISGLARTLK